MSGNPFYWRTNIARDPLTAQIAGYTITRHALNGQLWAQLLLLSIIASWRKEIHDARYAQATKAAGDAARAYAQTAPECAVDPASPECVANLKKAGIAAGMKVMHPGHFWLAIVAAFCVGIAMEMIFIR